MDPKDGAERLPAAAAKPCRSFGGQEFLCAGDEFQDERIRNSARTTAGSLCPGNAALNGAALSQGRRAGADPILRVRDETPP